MKSNVETILTPEDNSPSIADSHSDPLVVFLFFWPIVTSVLIISVFLTVYNGNGEDGHCATTEKQKLCGGVGPIGQSLFAVTFGQDAITSSHQPRDGRISVMSGH
jgi:hypothetical protein